MSRELEILKATTEITKGAVTGCNEAVILSPDDVCKFIKVIYKTLDEITRPTTAKES